MSEFDAPYDWAKAREVAALEEQYAPLKGMDVDKFKGIVADMLDPLKDKKGIYDYEVVCDKKPDSNWFVPWGVLKKESQITTEKPVENPAPYGTMDLSSIRPVDYPFKPEDYKIKGLDSNSSYWEPYKSQENSYPNSVISFDDGRQVVVVDGVEMSLEDYQNGTYGHKK